MIDEPPIERGDEGGEGNGEGVAFRDVSSFRERFLKNGRERFREIFPKRVAAAGAQNVRDAERGIGKMHQHVNEPIAEISRRHRARVADGGMFRLEGVLANILTKGIEEHVFRFKMAVKCAAADIGFFDDIPHGDFVVIAVREKFFERGKDGAAGAKGASVIHFRTFFAFCPIRNIRGILILVCPLRDLYH